jgi:hypothetical protein
MAAASAMVMDGDRRRRRRSEDHGWASRVPGATVKLTVDHGGREDILNRPRAEPRSQQARYLKIYRLPFPSSALAPVRSPAATSPRAWQACRKMAASNLLPSAELPSPAYHCDPGMFRT